MIKGNIKLPACRGRLKRNFTKYSYTCASIIDKKDIFGINYK